MISFSRLSFSQSGFDALLCLDGVLPTELDFYKLFSSIPIICADGAALQLRKAGIQADVIIGDFDSFHAHAEEIDFPHSLVICDPDQETNDFEKCLIHCQKTGFHSVLICGFHGGLLEHSLNNWSVFMRFSQLMNLCIYESMRYVLSIQQSIVFRTLPQEIISLIPQPAVRLSTFGLQWSLSNEWLCLGRREGARNRSTSGEVRIDIHEGCVLLACDARLPMKPIFDNQ